MVVGAGRPVKPGTVACSPEQHRSQHTCAREPRYSSSAAQTEVGSEDEIITSSKT